MNFCSSLIQTTISDFFYFAFERKLQFTLQLGRLAWEISSESSISSFTFMSWVGIEQNKKIIAIIISWNIHKGDINVSI